MNKVVQICLDPNASKMEILAYYNTEAELRNQPKLKRFTHTREKLVEKTKLMIAEHKVLDVHAKQLQSQSKNPLLLDGRILMKIDAKSQVEAEIAEMPEIQNADSIKDVACQLLTAVRCEDPNDSYTLHNGTVAFRVVGFSYASILAKIARMFPGSNTSNACLRWYLVRIRQEQECFDKYNMPIKFKRPKSMLGIK